ncbi:hypothetical protein BJ165DRAFT_1110049 [Panaeolus papilionaceus]|nr:hypothetical protein BJ165DRAFT_1110049 [Panaeolus papilionaceus]
MQGRFEDVRQPAIIDSLVEIITMLAHSVEDSRSMGCGGESYRPSTMPNKAKQMASICPHFSSAFPPLLTVVLSWSSPKLSPSLHLLQALARGSDHIFILHGCFDNFNLLPVGRLPEVQKTNTGNFNGNIPYKRNSGRRSRSWLLFRLSGQQ